MQWLEVQCTPSSKNASFYWWSWQSFLFWSLRMAQTGKIKTARHCSTQHHSDHRVREPTSDNLSFQIALPSDQNSRIHFFGRCKRNEERSQACVGFARNADTIYTAGLSMLFSLVFFFFFFTLCMVQEITLHVLLECLSILKGGPLSIWDREH